MATYAISDLHGNGKLWNMIKDFLKTEDTLYFLGDAADRGPDGWRILKEALNHPQVIYLMGNHDEMLADRISYPQDYKIAQLHNMNGGRPTWEKAARDPEAKDIMRKLRQLPRYLYYTNKDNKIIFMSHSGSTNINNEYDLVWDRHEFYTDYRPEGVDYIVHGHTTIPHLIDAFERINRMLDKPKYKVPDQDELTGAFWYGNNRCDIDCCTIATDMTVLLNLDTFEEKVFTI